MPMKRSWSWVNLLALPFLLALACGPASPQEKEQSAEIVGEIVTEIPEGVAFPDIAGKTLPNENCPVYLFSWERSAALRQLFEKLENDIKQARHAPAGSDIYWIIEKRRDDIYEEVTTSLLAQTTKTDQKGQFKFSQLEEGKKYLVVAAELQYEEGVLLLYRDVGPLRPGENKVRLVERW